MVPPKPPPQEFAPVTPGWEDRIRENLGVPKPTSTGLIESETRYPGAPIKQATVDHYVSQGNAARWELYGGRLQQTVEILVACLQSHGTTAVGNCPACNARVKEAEELLRSIK